MNKYLKLGIIVLLCLAFFMVKSEIDTVKTGEAAYINQAIKTRRNETQMWLNLGDVYVREGRYEDAIKAYKEAEKLNLCNPWIHNRLAITYQDLGHYEAAIESWKQVIKLKPGIAELHMLLGDAYIRAGRREQAILAYKQALSLDPLHSQAHYNLAKTYLEMNNKDLALENYEILMILDEDLAKELFDLLQKRNDI